MSLDIARECGARVNPYGLECVVFLRAEEFAAYTNRVRAPLLAVLKAALCELEEGLTMVPRNRLRLFLDEQQSAAIRSSEEGERT